LPDVLRIGHRDLRQGRSFVWTELQNQILQDGPASARPASTAHRQPFRAERVAGGDDKKSSCVFSFERWIRARCNCE
jgi:hypothetical protein